MIEGFEEYLAGTAFIQAKYITHYRRWVSSCYSHLDQPDTSLLTQEQVKGYLTHISKTREDWQVQQAEAALRLYEYYLSSKLKEPANSPETVASSDTRDIWSAMVKSAQDALRLRHRSYSTEKTYLSWLRAFGNYVKWKAPAELSTVDMQDFLSSLAIERRVAPSTQNQAFFTAVSN